MSNQRVVEVETTLPPSEHPYRFVFFKDHLVVVNEEHGCLIYDNGDWKKCIPVSNNPMIYHPSWYYQA